MVAPYFCTRCRGRYHGDTRCAQPGSVPIDDQIACVRREVGLRARVYPRFVAAGKLTQAAADRELAAMRAVLDTLERARDAARPRLFQD